MRLLSTLGGVALVMIGMFMLVITFLKWFFNGFPIPAAFGMTIIAIVFVLCGHSLIVGHVVNQGKN